MSRFSKQIFTIIIFSLIFISCGGNSTSEVVEIQETTTTLTTTTSTSTTTTTLTTTTSTLPDIMPTVLINCEPVESFTMAEGYMNFNFEITTGTNELVVLNIVSWFDSSRTDDLFIYDGLPSPGSSNEFGYRVDDNFSQYEIEIVVMDSKDNFANDYCLYEQNPDESNPSTTTTTTTTTPTTTTTTVPPTTTTNIEIKLPNETNQFPEIPYCKMTYEEVEKQINDFFQNNNIRITIREFIVQTDNVNCYGYVSGSNYSYTDTVESGDFIEITVEGEANKRKFPTTIANVENAKGNNEFFRIYCDLNGLPKTEEYWNGVQIDINGIRDVVLYSQPNDLDINLNDPYSNCGEESVLDNTCFWRVELKNGARVYRNPNFRAIPHYGTGPYATSEGEPFNTCLEQRTEKEWYVSTGGGFD